MDVELLEKKLGRYRYLSDQIRLLEQEKKELSQELLQNYPAPTAKFHTPQFSVSRHSRISITTTVEHARDFHATKIEEIVDKEKLKSLHLQGLLIPGITVSEYLLVKAKTP